MRNASIPRVAIIFGLAMAVGVLLRLTWQSSEPSDEAPAYVDNAECLGCHAEEGAAWLGSHHDLAMQPARDETVLGDFDDAMFTQFGVTSHFFKAAGKYWVETENAAGEVEPFEVSYVFGVEPLQQYLIEFPGGRLQCLTVAWDTEKGRWFHLYPDERILPDDPLHWTGRLQNWNFMCAECHSTDLRKGYDPKTDTYNTTWKEIDVSCQACHGPGEAHVAWAQEGQPASADLGLQVPSTAATAREQVETCAPCHARRHQVSLHDQPGGEFLDDFMPELLRADLYHAGGQILEEVYVYGSFVQSKMYAAGVRCSDCHDPHSLQLRHTGDELCTQCHQEAPDERFESLTQKRYDTPAHHHHPQDSEGARCVGCHMIERNYMVVDGRRDHSFRVPRPDLSVVLGTPNSCNDCHDDESARWARDRVVEWYGSDRPRHYAPVLAAGHAGAPEAMVPLVQVSLDGESPAIVRATALYLLRGFGPDPLRAASPALEDDDPVVRATAVGGLDQLSLEERVRLARPLLDDPVRAVRLQAGRTLAAVPAELLTPEATEARDLALAEYVELQQMLSDTPSAHLNLAVLHEIRGNLPAAVESYLRALQLQASFLPARFNLAHLYNRQGDNDRAEQLLREGLQFFPEEGELHYSLGLLLAEMNSLEKAAHHLARAAKLMPRRLRVQLNLGLLLSSAGRAEEAETAFLAALDLDPQDPDLLNALASFYLEQGDRERAGVYAAQLEALRSP